jgi:hypothetical protein
MDACLVLFFLHQNKSPKGLHHKEWISLSYQVCGGVVTKITQRLHPISFLRNSFHMGGEDHINNRALVNGVTLCHTH